MAAFSISIERVNSALVDSMDLFNSAFSRSKILDAHTLPSQLDSANSTAPAPPRDINAAPATERSAAMRSDVGMCLS